MLCPNCGTVLEEIALKCNYCGYDIMSLEQKKKTPEPETQNPVIEQEQQESYQMASGAPWVGPRCLAHICSIIAGILVIHTGYMIYSVWKLASLFSADAVGGEQAAWCICFGVILIVLGIVGLVKIHSRTVCGAMVVLHIVAVLPFGAFQDLLVPQTDIFVAFLICLSVVVCCGGVLTTSGGTVSGWVTVGVLVAIIIFVNSEKANATKYEYPVSQEYRKSVEMVVNVPGTVSPN